jgi:hypothetical protein
MMMLFGTRHMCSMIVSLFQVFWLTESIGYADPYDHAS